MLILNQEQVHGLQVMLIRKKFMGFKFLNQVQVHGLQVMLIRNKFMGFK